MRRLVIVGFLALLAIDTSQQVFAKLLGDSIGPFEIGSEWVRQLVRQPLLYLVLGLYVVAFLIYSWLLRHAAVGPSYAALHGHVVTTVLFSLLFLGERLTLLQLSGCGMIVLGIVLLAATEEL